MFVNETQLDAALSRLGKRLLYEYAEPISLVVCGGSAMIATATGTRNTGDVDVLVIVEDGKLLIGKDL